MMIVGGARPMSRCFTESKKRAIVSYQLVLGPTRQHCTEWHGLPPLDSEHSMPRFWDQHCRVAIGTYGTKLRRSGADMAEKAPLLMQPNQHHISRVVQICLRAHARCWPRRTISREGGGESVWRSRGEMLVDCRAALVVTGH